MVNCEYVFVEIYAKGMETNEQGAERDCFDMESDFCFVELGCNDIKSYCNCMETVCLLVLRDSLRVERS